MASMGNVPDATRNIVSIGSRHRKRVVEMGGKSFLKHLNLNFPQ
jgi:hypothetical protein